MDQESTLAEDPASNLVVITDSDQTVDSLIDEPVDQLTLPTINAENYQRMLTEAFKVMNRDFVGQIDTHIASDFGSSQPDTHEVRDLAGVVRIDESDQYACLAGGSLEQPPSAYELGEITLSNCVVGEHTYSGHKRWHTAGRSGRRIAFEDFHAVNHDGVSGFRISGGNSSFSSLVEGSVSYRYHDIELTEMTGESLSIDSFGLSFRSASNSINRPGVIYYSSHEKPDGSFIDLSFFAEDRSMSSGFTFRSSEFSNQAVSVSLEFERDYAYYTDNETGIPVEGTQIRVVYNHSNPQARGDWFTPGSPPASDNWLEGEIRLSAADGSEMVIGLNPDDAETLLINISGVSGPFVVHWSELEALGLMYTGKRT